MLQIRVPTLGGEDLLEEEMATCSSVLAWRILWTEKPGGLQSIGSQRVSHDRTCMHVEAATALAQSPAGRWDQNKNDHPEGSIPPRVSLLYNPAVSSMQTDLPAPSLFS